MSDRMSSPQVLEIIDAARARGERPSLAYRNLAHMDLAGLDLSGVDFTGAYMPGVYAPGVDLTRSILYRANLTGAYLAGANLYRARLIGLFLDGLPSGNLIFLPTTDGWHLTIGCWSGTTTELREMIAGDEGWPEAEGEDISVLRPALMAAADMCDTYAASYPDAVAQVRNTAAR